MGCLGVHFALTEDEVAHLRSLDDDALLEHLKSDLEDTYFEDLPDLLAQSDKAWDAMHRALSDGELSWDSGEYPLNHTVLAGELLYDEPDYIVSLKSPAQVQDIAAALQHINEDDFRQRYFAINAEGYGFPLSQEDFAYTWDWFQNVRGLYERAARQGRYVLFTADQ